MKTKTKLIAAGAALVLLAGFYFGGTLYRQAKIEKAQEAYKTIKITDLGADKVVKIDIPASGLVLEKKGENWEANLKVPVKLDQEEIKGAAWSLANMSADRVLEENPKDLAAYGLDKPKSRIILSLTDGGTIELWGGNQSPTKTSYYAMKKGENKVYAAPLYPGERLYLKLSDLRDKKLPTFEPQEVQHFRLLAGKTKIEVEKKGENEPFVSSFASHVVTSPYKMRRAVDPDAFGRLVQGLKDLKIKNFTEDRPASLAPYGLDKPAYDVFVQAGNSSLHLLIGKETDRVNEVYAKLDGEAAVFTIEDLRQNLAVKPFALIDKFPLILGIDKVDSFVVKGRGKTYTGEIKREKKTVVEKDKDGKETSKEETKETFFLNGKEAEESSFKDFYQACIGLLADAERPAGPVKAAEPEVVIEYRLNTPKGLKTSLRLVPENRDFCAAVHDGIAEFYVSKLQAGRIFEAAENIKEKK